jgi:Fe-S oxidoreductase
MGEEGLFRYFVDHSATVFKDNGVKRVICFSPHDFDAFRTYCPDLGMTFEHYTETLYGLLADKTITIKGEYRKIVKYQDPCYLGRRNKVYDPPRKILDTILGIKCIEMEKTKHESHCCGGGGVGLWLDFQDVRMDLQRADEAHETGAQVIAVACPVCLQMLDSAVKARGFDMEVKDVAQILQEIIEK